MPLHTDEAITFAYNAGNVTLNRIQNDGYGSVYFGEATDMKLTLTVKHTIPARDESGESHLVRLDVDHYASGVYVRTSSAWVVIRTDGGVQDQESSEDAAEAIVDFCSDGNITKIVGRQS
jgi:hypothetical protein